MELTWQGLDPDDCLQRIAKRTCSDLDREGLYDALVLKPPDTLTNGGGRDARTRCQRLLARPAVFQQTVDNRAITRIQRNFFHCALFGKWISKQSSIWRIYFHSRWYIVNRSRYFGA